MRRLAFQPVDKVIELTAQYNLAGQLVENKFYAKCADVVTSAMCTELAAILDLWVTTTFMPVMSSSLSYVRSIARDLTSEGSFESIDSTGTGAVGGGGPDTDANNVSFAMHRQTVFSGKKQKSRIYLPTLPFADLSDPNHVLSTAAAIFRTALDTLFTAIAAGSETTYTNGYVSRVLDHVPRVAGLFVESTGWSWTDLIIDSMRRRLPGRGI